MEKEQPFALVMLNSLRVARFGNKDDLNDAIKALKTRGIKYIVLKYHNGIESYVVPEVIDIDDSEFGM